MAFVYILKSLSTNRYYIGCTNNLRRRISEHQRGLVKSTRPLSPLKLEFFQEFETLSHARKIEYKLKRFKSRKIIDKIVKEKVIRTD